MTTETTTKRKTTTKRVTKNEQNPTPDVVVDTLDDYNKQVKHIINRYAQHEHIKIILACDGKFNYPLSLVSDFVKDVISDQPKKDKSFYFDLDLLKQCLEKFATSYNIPDDKKEEFINEQTQRLFEIIQRKIGNNMYVSAVIYYNTNRNQFTYDIQHI